MGIIYDLLKLQKILDNKVSQFSEESGIFVTPLDKIRALLHETM